jgi:dTDP-4-amino-4,6-dideoxygalactose transaminase
MAIPLFDTATPQAPLQDEIRARVSEVIARGAFILGPELEAFEREFAEYLGVRHVIGVGNGTDAITIALRAMGIRPGDEVVVPSLTFYASAEAAVNAGARPVFCDVDPDTRNVSVETVREVMTPQTRAILAVDLFGHRSRSCASSACRSSRTRPRRPGRASEAAARARWRTRPRSPSIRLRTSAPTATAALS